MRGSQRPSVLRHGSVRRILSCALALGLAGGVGSVPEAWTATFYVAPGGSDGHSPAQAQNPATPWQTLTHALAQPLAPGDVVQVQPGTYGVGGNAETFPLPLVNGVAILGSPSNPALTTIEAPPDTDVFLAGGALNNQTTLSGFTITHSAAGTFNGVEIDASSTTVAPQISHNAFAGFLTDTGVMINDLLPAGGAFTGQVTQNTFTGTDDGVGVLAALPTAGSTFSPSITNNTFTGNRFPIAVLAESSAEGTVSPTIAGNTLTGVGVTGVVAAMSLTTGSGANLSPMVRGNTVTGAARADAGIFVALERIHLAPGGSAALSPTVANNTVTGGLFGIDLEMFDTGTSSTAATAGQLVSTATVTGNQLAMQAGFGIAGSFGPFIDPAFDNLNVSWTVSNNTLTSQGGLGIAIAPLTGGSSSTSFAKASGALQLAVTGNAVSGTGVDGINVFLNDTVGGNLTRAVHLEQNTVQGAARGGMVLSYAPAQVSADDVTVRDNYLTGNQQAGLVFSTFSNPGELPSLPPVLRCNTITGNTLDGVVHTSAALAADYGTVASPGRNTLSGNTASGGFDFDHEQSSLATSSLTARNNFWGSATGPTAAQIHGRVAFTPFLTALAPTVAVPLTVAVVNDVSPPGPSVGDTLRYTATIQMANTCGCAQTIFSAPIPANVSEVTGSATTSQGTVTSENPIQVNLGGVAATAGPITVQWDVVVNSGTAVSTQGTLSCNGVATLSNDPTTPAPSDPTVIALVTSIAAVPALGPLGLALLVGGLLAAGILQLRRRRVRGAGAFLLVLLAFGAGGAGGAGGARAWGAAGEEAAGRAGGAGAARRTATASPGAAAPAAPAARTPGSRPSPPSRPQVLPPPTAALLNTVAGAVPGGSSNAITLTLAGGVQLPLAGVHVELRDKRPGLIYTTRVHSFAALQAALNAGAGVLVKVSAAGPGGAAPSRVVLVIVQSPQAAQHLLARYHPYKP